jgi:hypothetical protein
MTKPVGDFHAQSGEFLLKQYECLRKEIEILIQESRALERNAIIAVGVTWAWLYSRGKPVHAWTYFIPILFSAIGALRAYGIEKAFGQMGSFISKLEYVFLDNRASALGWESIEDDGSIKPKTGTSDSRGAFLFWCLLNLSTIIIAVLAFIPNAL